MEKHKATKPRVVTYLTDEERAVVDKIKAKTGASMSEWLHRLIKRELKELSRRKGGR